MIAFVLGLAVGAASMFFLVGAGLTAKACFYAGRWSGIRESHGVLRALRGELTAIEHRLGYKCGAVRGEG